MRHTVTAIDVSVHTVPTDGPGGQEADGTLEWDSTTCVVVQAHAADRTGVGYTYGPEAIATYIRDTLEPIACGSDPLRAPATWAAMQHASRNNGTTGVVAMAISAVDNALWDLHARLLDVPLVTVLGDVHEHANIYGSGGFCNYDRERLQEQLGSWVAQGIPRVKMKVARDPEGDRDRLDWAREAIGEQTELLVDANGAYQPAQAREWARWFADRGVTWLEEPVSSDDVRGLAAIRRAAPPGLAITAGEYGWDLGHFQRLLEHDAVDVVQPDVTRCGGYTAFLRVDALCRARNLALSAHCAPAQSVHAVCACETALHIEYFHDHVRIESQLFDGTLEPQPGGRLVPDRSRPGNGLELRARAAS